MAAHTVLKIVPEFDAEGTKQCTKALAKLAKHSREVSDAWEKMYNVFAELLKKTEEVTNVDP